MVTDEASQETEDGDGDGEGPVPVDDHRHGPGGREVVGDQEDQHQQESDDREEAGQPGEGLTTEKVHILVRALETFLTKYENMAERIPRLVET